MKSRWVAIEFVGLPGAGKSTLSRRVAGILQGRGLPVEQPTYTVDHEMQRWERYLLKLRLVSGEVFLHPFQTIRSVRAILGTRQTSGSDLVGVTANWVFMSALLRKAEHREGIHIFDEGLINALWSIGFSAGSAATAGILRELARQRSTPVVAALIEADIPSVRRRLEQRRNGQSRLERRAPTEATWDRARAALDQVKGMIRVLAEEGPQVHVIAVRSHELDALDLDAVELATRIEAIWTSQTSR